MVYFICGHRGCGKSYMVNQIKQNVDCTVYDTGPIMRNYFKNLNLSVSLGEWIRHNEEIYGSNFTDNIVCENMDLNLNDVNIIIGNRSLVGIDYIIDYFGITNYKICYIDGDYDLFCSNYNTREGLSLSREEFNKFIELENSMGIKDIEDFVKENPDVGLYFFKKDNNDSILDVVLEDMNRKPIVRTREDSYKGDVD